MNHRCVGSGAILVGVLLGCQSKSGESPAPTATADASMSAPTLPAHAALEAMDKRSPVPLLPMMANHQKQNMRDHLVAVQEIVAAVGVKDFAAIEKASGRIGFSEQMGQMCSHMGAGAPGFTEQALNFHHTADKIGDAAKKHDTAAVLEALSATLSTCTACHAGFKQQVVDDVSWTQTTKMSPPSHSPR